MYEKMQAIGVITKSRRLARVLKNHSSSVFNSAERANSSLLDELAIENACEFSYSHSPPRRFHSAALFSGTLYIPMSSPLKGEQR